MTRKVRRSSNSSIQVIDGPLHELPKEFQMTSRVPSHGKVHDLSDHLGIRETGFLRGHEELLSA